MASFDPNIIGKMVLKETQVDKGILNFCEYDHNWIYCGRIIIYKVMVIF